MLCDAESCQALPASLPQEKKSSDDQSKTAGLRNKRYSSVLEAETDIDYNAAAPITDAAAFADAMKL